MHADMLALMHETLDGTATPVQTAQLAAHLRACTECASAWRALAAVHRTLQTPGLAAPAPGFTGRVMARIAAERAPRAAYPRLAQGAVVIGATLTAAALLALRVWPEDTGDLLTTLLAASVAFEQALITWLAVLGTLVRTALAAGGDTLLAAGLVLTLVLIGAWAWLMAGASRPGRRAL